MKNGKKHLKILKSENGFVIEANSNQYIKRIAHFAFCSRLLFALSPDENGVWVEIKSKRTNYFIDGFPPDFKFKIKSPTKIEIILEKNSNKYEIDKLQAIYEKLFKDNLNNFVKKEINFKIVNGDNQTESSYSFINASRTVVALCVLYDLKDHPRNHLEVNLNSLYDLGLLRKSNSQIPLRLYGDPSKCVDELRNQGFPRETDQSENGVSIKIFRKDAYGNKQEHYQLLNKSQILQDRVGRSNISKKYKELLYKASDYKCNNCGQLFPFEYLAPDHRIPSIVEDDSLSEDNFLSKLQTLCVRCNQVKRESCKKCPYNHDCQKCAWAFPEKFSINPQSINKLICKAKTVNMNVNTYIDNLLEN